MAETQIRFEDGLSYERYMRDWSRRVGTVFLDWLALPSGLKWIDVGCGNGAFTELIVERCAPNEVRGIDPSEADIFDEKADITSATKSNSGAPLGRERLSISSDNRVYRKFGKAVCKRLPARWSFRQIDEVRLRVAAQSDEFDQVCFACRKRCII
jgi:SAM-dependent methyltransferase